ncbi:MAG: endonuclease/exonuclease/phosphatase family protein [Thermoplasmata archaeon]|nr:endonuclease/exonuclease/phosphatase family protein [Thermoplasmata archaeon]
MKKADECRVPLKCPALINTLWYILIALTFLFLLQSFRELYSSIYYYSLVGMGLNGATAAVLIMLAPLTAPVLTRFLGWRGTILIGGAVLVASRIPMSLGLEAPFHLIFSLIAFGSASVVLTISLALHRRERRRDPEAFSSQGFTGAIALSFLLLIALNTAGMGQDASIALKPNGLLLSPLLGFTLSGTLGLLLLLVRNGPHLDDRRGEEVGSVIKGGISDSWAPALGLGGFLFISFSLIPYPLAISAWTGMELQWALSMSLVSISLFIMSLFNGSGILITIRRGLSTPKGAIIGNLMMIGGALNLFYLGIPLPSAPAGIIFIVLVDLWMIVDAITDSRPFKGEPIEVGPQGKRRILGFSGPQKGRRTPHVFGYAMAISNSIAFLLAIALTMSLNWAHAPTGTLLKGQLQFLMFLGMALLALGGFSCSKVNMDEPSPKIMEELHLGKGSPATAAGKGAGKLHSGGRVSGRLKVQWITVGALTLCLIFISMGLSFFLYNIGDRDTALDGDLKVVTYNIHQGFSNAGRVDLVQVCQELERIDADVIFLQESEGIWPHSGVVDPVRFLAHRLDMNFVRGPEVKEGIYGVSILSRTRLTDHKVHFLDSREEQRVAVSCRATVSGREMTFISVHMGLTEEERGEQMAQLSGIIQEMDGEVIVGGDFNTEPDDPIMAYMNSNLFGDVFNGGNVSNVTSLGLGSAWHTAQSRNAPLDTPTFPAEGIDLPLEHIDYILFSPTMLCVEAGIEDGAVASDHRPVWAILRP